MIITPTYGQMALVVCLRDPTFCRAKTVSAGELHRVIEPFPHFSSPVANIARLLRRVDCNR